MSHLANTETINDFAMSLPGVTQSFPFDESTLVFLRGKDVCLLGRRRFCWSELDDLSERLSSEISTKVLNPGYHSIKVHWNTVVPEPLSDVETKLFWELILHSYDLVRGSLTKKVQAEISPRPEF